MKTIIEISEKIRDHLTEQKMKSIHRTAGGFHCAYRGAGGTMCAVGCLIDEEHYSSSIEGESVFSEEVLNALVKSGIISESHNDEDHPVIRFLGMWQAYHDGFGAGFGDGPRINYHDWIDGEEEYSPEHFHQHIIKVYANAQI